MRDFVQGSTQVPARTATTLDAENARLDAQLELAAKKAALAGMQRAGAEAPAPPAIPVVATGGTVTIEKDGKTITLENPTAEQLAAVTSSGTSQRGGDVSGWQLVALTGTVVWGVAAVIWMYLAHRRRSHSVGTMANSHADTRMARIENAIESIAVEVERISEGQRYTSRMLSEGAAMPVSAADRAAGVLQNRGDV